MGRHIIWTHGNAVAVESPEKLEPGDRNFGWGADLTLLSGEGSWFHAPLPVPSRVDGYPVQLRRVFLLFRTEANAFLRNVHVYDGAVRVQTFDELHFDGDFTGLVVPANTFALSRPHAVRRGIGVSFFVQGTSGPVPNRLVVPAVGAEYDVVIPLLSSVADLFDRVTRAGP